MTVGEAAHPEATDVVWVAFGVPELATAAAVPPEDDGKTLCWMVLTVSKTNEDRQGEVELAGSGAHQWCGLDRCKDYDRRRGSDASNNELQKRRCVDLGDGSRADGK